MSKVSTEGSMTTLADQDRPAPAPRPVPAPCAGPEPHAHAPAMTMQQTVINVGSRKSVAGAVILALLFGPLGMLYSTVLGGVVMFFATLVIAVPTLGVGLLLTVPVGAIWAGMAAGASNRRIAHGVSHTSPPGPVSQLAPMR